MKIEVKIVKSSFCIKQNCFTFSWLPEAGMKQNNLVVYRSGEGIPGIRQYQTLYFSVNASSRMRKSLLRKAAWHPSTPGVKVWILRLPKDQIITVYIFPQNLQHFYAWSGFRLEKCNENNDQPALLKATWPDGPGKRAEKFLFSDCRLNTSQNATMHRLEILTILLKLSDSLQFHYRAFQM